MSNSNKVISKNGSQIASTAKKILETCIKAGTGHANIIPLSCLDIMIALYHGQILKFDPKDPGWGGEIGLF